MRDDRGLMVRAEEAYHDDDLDEAARLLITLTDRQPNNGYALKLLLQICYEQRNTQHYAAIADRLHDLYPNDPELLLCAAGAFLESVQPTRSLLAFQKFLKRHTGHPMTDEVVKQVESLQPKIDEFVAKSDFPNDRRYQLAALHEQALFATSMADYRTVVRVTTELLDAEPDFVSAKNNLSHALYQTGDIDRAIQIAHDVLNVDPNNVHALGNLTKFLLLAGRIDEAENLAERLRDLNPESAESCSKIAEGLSFLGDDAGILKVFKLAKQQGWLSTAGPEVVLLYHLAAVAFANQDDWSMAKRMWQKALDRDSDFTLAVENLADAKLPVGQRNGPWAYGISYWMTDRDFREQLTIIEKYLDAEAGLDDPRFEAEFTAWANQRPHIEKLLPTLLRRSGELGRTFAERYALLIGTESAVEALRDFVSSPFASDSYRLQVAQRMRDTGQLSDKPIMMFTHGEQREVLIRCFDISDEPIGVPNHTPQVHQWALDAHHMLCKEDGEGAEGLLRKAIEIEPDSPSLRNNLATALMIQGQTDEALKLTKEIHREFPDYLFSRVMLVVEAIEQGNTDEAESLIEPMRRRQRFHRSEFISYCKAEIHLCIHQKKYDGAESWLEMLRPWAEHQLDFPGLEEMVSRRPSRLLRYLLPADN